MMKRLKSAQDNSPGSPTSRSLRDLHVRRIPIEQVIPDPRNARSHSDAQVAAVAASICEFGWTNPILVRPDGVVIAGHARLLAARKLGMREVPVIELSGLNEAQCRALAIADNQLALNANWDEDLLRAELAALQEQNFALEVVGFDEQELARLLAQEDAAGRSIDPDAVPPALQAAVTAPGDLWLLGEHRLLCGDALSNQAIDVVLGGNRADMAFTDPPDRVWYELTLDNDSLGTGYQDLLETACAKLIAVCRGAIYVCISPSELQNLYRAFIAAGGHWSAFIIWAERQPTPGRSDYFRQHQPILYGWREGSDHYWCGARDQGDVWTIPLPMAQREHATMKPVALVERAVENSSRRGDTVLDLFAGSGTTLIACERLERRACLIEADPRYVDVICERWEQYSGKSAHRNEDGVAFVEFAQQRKSMRPDPNAPDAAPIRRPRK
jgi:DNA modification methylase